MYHHNWNGNNNLRNCNHNLLRSHNPGSYILKAKFKAFFPFKEKRTPTPIEAYAPSMSPTAYPVFTSAKGVTLLLMKLA